MTIATEQPAPSSASARMNGQASNTHPVFTLERVFVTGQQLQTFDLLSQWQKGEWHPKTDIDLKPAFEPWGAVHYLVKLALHYVIKNQEQPLLELELTQAGLFRLERLTELQQAVALNGTAPDLLFPYVAQAVTQITASAGLPPQGLNPISFTQLYHQQQAQASEVGS